MSSEIVADPVGHISISGVHGRDELNERLRNGSRVAKGERGRISVGQMLASTAAGAALGAAVMYLLDPARGRGRRARLKRRLARRRGFGFD